MVGVAGEAPTKACAFCGGPILDNRPHRIRSIRSDVKFCGPRCRFEAFIAMHPGRPRSGGRHKPAPQGQPETERQGAVARTTYYDMPTLAGFDEAGDPDSARS